MPSAVMIRTESELTPLIPHPIELALMLAFLLMVVTTIVILVWWVSRPRGRADRESSVQPPVQQHADPRR